MLERQVSFVYFVLFFACFLFSLLPVSGGSKGWPGGTDHL